MLRRFVFTAAAVAVCACTPVTNTGSTTVKGTLWLPQVVTGKAWHV
jgi:hypothetical protein